MIVSDLIHPGQFLLIVAAFAVPALGLLLFLLADRVMYRSMHRLEHPEEPIPRRRYQRGLAPAIERLRIDYRYFLRYGFDANVLRFVSGLLLIVAGLVFGENLDAIADLLGWN